MPVSIEERVVGHRRGSHYGTLLLTATFPIASQCVTSFLFYAERAYRLVSVYHVLAANSAATCSFRLEQTVSTPFTVGANIGGAVNLNTMTPGVRYGQSLFITGEGGADVIVAGTTLQLRVIAGVTTGVQGLVTSVMLMPEEEAALLLGGP